MTNPMIAALSRLFSSSKGLVLIASIIAMTALVLTHNITVDKFVDYQKWVVSVWLGAQALEGAAEKFGLPPVTVANAAGSDLQVDVRKEITVQNTSFPNS